MRRLVLAVLVVLVPAAARADFGLGLFLGEPSGLDLKVGLGPRSGVDAVIGVTSIPKDRRTDYFHLTYLLTPFVGRGRSVLVPIRIGIGGALIGAADGHPHVAVRVPLELGLRFRRTPMELYGEIAIKGTFYEDPVIDFDVDGGVGLRFYF